MVEKREVNEHDVYLLDQHVMNHSDDYRFVGYQSRPKELIDRYADASEKLRGVPIPAIHYDVAKQHEVIDRKKEAIINLVAANNDDKYHLSNQVVSSYVSKMMDDYAIAETIGDELISMEYDHQFSYYHPNDTDLTYATFNFHGRENKRDRISHDADDLDELKDYVAHMYPDIELESMKEYSPYEIVYLDSQDHHDTESRRAYFRDAYIGEVAEIGEQDNPTQFISINSGSLTDNLGHDGIYGIGDDMELYQYTANMNRAKKISGKDGVWEAKHHTLVSGFLNGSRGRLLEVFKEELETETGRLNDFDFTDLERSLDEQYVAPTPKFELVDNTKSKEKEDELEL